MEPAPTRRSPQHGLLLVIGLVAPVALVGLGLWLRPDPRGWGTHEQLGFRPCYPMDAWHLPCPGCGVTTAVALAARGKGVASLRTQPFGLASIVACVAVAIWAVREHARGRDLPVSIAALPWRALLGVAAALALMSWAYKVAAVRGWT